MVTGREEKIGFLAKPFLENKGLRGKKKSPTQERDFSHFPGTIFYENIASKQI
jgi:hypothetical protein